MKILALLFLVFGCVYCSVDWSGDKCREKWHLDAKNTLNKMLNKKLNGNIAKNVILFLGDGMGMSTITSGRIRKGQINNRNGEEEVTNIEKMDHVGLAKTYNIDKQTADSAGTGTALLTGVKTFMGAIGVDGYGIDCPSSLNSKLESMIKWAHYAGKSTGIVTNTRITHATPASAYANTPERYWEAFGGDLYNETHFKQGCKDIASQLIEDNSFINVIFGGGRNKFLRNTDRDYQTQRPGHRIDNRNLIEEWIKKMQDKNLNYKFLWNKTDFDSLNETDGYDHVLGLFSFNHLDYEVDRIRRNPIVEPSLVELTEKAIKILSRNPNGFFLFVEGGRIDQAHHDSNARRAIDEFVVFDEAVGVGKNLVSSNDTLIIATADHSHVFTLGGHADRGNSIFGIVQTSDQYLSILNTTFTALQYGNGPGFNLTHIRTYNLTNEITENINYIQESAVPLKYESHGGEDVPIYASGPMSYLFDGTVEQSYVAHVMAYSACIGPYNLTNYPDCKFRRGVLFN